jgi:hypothetical protein
MRLTSYNEKEMEDTMGFVVYHTRKTGFDGKKDIKGKRLQGDGR